MLNDGLILSALMALFGAARILCERWDAKAARRADILTVRRIRHDFYLGMFFCSLALLAALSWPGIKSDAVLIALLITFVAWFFALSVNPDLLVRSGSIVRRYTPEKSSPVGNVDPSGFWYTTVFGPLGPYYLPSLGGCVIGFEHIVAPSWYNDIFGTPRIQTYYTYYPLNSGITWTPQNCRPGFPGHCFTDNELEQLEIEYAHATFVEEGLQALRATQYTEIEDGFFGIGSAGAGGVGLDSISAGIFGIGGVYGVSY